MTTPITRDTAMRLATQAFLPYAARPGPMTRTTASASP